MKQLLHSCVPESVWSCRAIALPLVSAASCFNQTQCATRLQSLHGDKRCECTSRLSDP